MSTHNICFREEISNIISKLSSNIIKYVPYLFFCYCRSVMFTSDEYSSDQKVKSKNKPDAVDKGKDADEIKPIPPERPSHTLPTDKQPLPANMEVECGFCFVLLLVFSRR